MTWSSKDAMPVSPRSTTATPPVPGTGAAPPLSIPEQIPTYAQQRGYLLESDEEHNNALTAEQERMLAAEGIWPEREWSIWRHAVTRGIKAY